MFPGGQPRPHPNGRGPSVPQNFVGPPTYAHPVCGINNQILHGDQTRSEVKFLLGRPRMLTRNLFAVANLLVINGMVWYGIIY